MMLEAIGILFILFMPFVYLFVLCYLLLSLFFNSKFSLSRVPDLVDCPNRLSVVIPFRNEAANIRACLQGLRQQQGLDLEIILVDDHSDDLSAEIAEVELEGMNGRVIMSRGQGKKAALLTGISEASNPIVWTSDADTVLSRNGLVSMLRHFHYRQLNMLCGLVQIESNDRIFGDLQQAESAALVGLSAVFLNIERPATCNGANLMFRKEVFYRLGAYGSDTQTSSGDDDLLMQKFAEYDRSKVRYHVLPESSVSTPAETGFMGFIQQRARWASKHRRYIYPYNSILLVMMATRIFIYLFLLLLSVLTFSPWFVLPFMVLLFSDILMALRIKEILRFKLLCVPLLPVYQLYIPLVLLFVLFRKPEWKGRQVISSDEKI